MFLSLSHSHLPQSLSLLSLRTLSPSFSPPDLSLPLYLLSSSIRASPSLFQSTSSISVITLLLLLLSPPPISLSSHFFFSHIFYNCKIFYGHNDCSCIAISQSNFHSHPSLIFAGKAGAYPYLNKLECLSLSVASTLTSYLQSRLEHTREKAHTKRYSKGRL